MLIPKIIHVIWIGPNPYPYGDYKDTWLEHNPDWELKFWTDDNLPPLYNQEIFDMMPVWAAKADILRYELLYNYGGVYSDADSYCKKPLEPLIGNLTCFAMISNKGKTVCNAILGATKNHPSYEKIVYGLKDHIDGIKRRQKKGRLFSTHQISGAFYISPILYADPSFVQIDAGKKAGTREHFCAVSKKGSRKNDDDSNAYIVTTHDGSWKKQTKKGYFKI